MSLLLPNKRVQQQTLPVPAKAPQTVREKQRSAEDDAGFFSSFSASFQRENPIINMFQENPYRFRTNAEFQPLQYAAQNDMLDGAPSSAVPMIRNSDTPEEVEQAISDAERQRDLKEQMDNGLGTFLGGVAGATLSPTNIFPAKLAANTGRSVIQAALKVGGAETAAAATDEAILQSLQENRSFLESTVNTISSGVLGGALGGVSAGISARISEEGLKTKLTSDIENQQPTRAGSNADGGYSSPTPSSYEDLERHVNNIMNKRDLAEIKRERNRLNRIVTGPSSKETEDLYAEAAGFNKTQDEKINDAIDKLRRMEDTADSLLDGTSKNSLKQRRKAINSWLTNNSKDLTNKGVESQSKRLAEIFNNKVFREQDQPETPVARSRQLERSNVFREIRFGHTPKTDPRASKRSPKQFKELLQQDPARRKQLVEDLKLERQNIDAKLKADQRARQFRKEADRKIKEMRKSDIRYTDRHFKQEFQKNRRNAAEEEGSEFRTDEEIDNIARIRTFQQERNEAPKLFKEIERLDQIIQADATGRSFIQKDNQNAFTAAIEKFREERQGSSDEAVEELADNPAIQALFQERLDQNSLSSVNKKAAIALNPIHSLRTPFLSNVLSRYPTAKRAAKMFFKTDLRTKGDSRPGHNITSLEGRVESETNKVNNLLHNQVNPIIKQMQQDNPDVNQSEILRDISTQLYYGVGNVTPRFERSGSVAQPIQHHLERIGRDLVKEGLLPPRGKLDNYFKVAFNIDEIHANSSDFKIRLKKGLKERVEETELGERPTPPEELVRKDKETKGEFDARKQRQQDLIDDWEELQRRKNMTNIEWDDEVEKVFRNITGQTNVQFDAPGIQGVSGNTDALKPRSLDMDHFRWLTKDIGDDYINTDPVAMYSKYMAQMVPKLKLKEVLREEGFLSFSHKSGQELSQSLMGQLDLEREIGQKLLKKSGAADREIRSFNNELGTIKNDIQRQAQNLLGITKPGVADAFLRNARRYTTMTLLGNLAIATAQDFALPILNRGIVEPFKLGWSQLADRDMRKMFRKDLEELGIATEHVRAQLLMALTDGGTSRASKVSSIDMYGDEALRYFGQLSLGTPITNTAKLLSGTMGQNRILGTIEDFMNGKLTRNSKKVKEIAALGLDVDNDIPRIWSEFNKHGEKYGKNAYFSDYSAWDPVVREKMASAVSTVADSAIITPKKGDIPTFFQDNELGRTIFQFKSFLSAATNKMTIKGLQEKDSRVLSGLVALTGLGMLSQAAKEALSGKNFFEDFDEKPASKVMSGVLSSGVLGLMTTSALELAPGAQSSRYAESTLVGYLLGPNATLMTSMYKSLVEVGNNATEGEFLSDATLGSVSDSMPFVNIFWMREITNQLGVTER